MGIKTLKIGSPVIIRDGNQKATIADISGNTYYLEGEKNQYRASDLISEKNKTGFKMRVKINQVSDLTKKLKEIYRVYSKVWLQHNKLCRAKYEGCTHFATQVHHMAGRDGFWLIMSKYFFPICGRCHRKATPKSREAINNGVSVSRHKKLEFEFSNLEKELITKAGLAIPENVAHM